MFKAMVTHRPGLDLRPRCKPTGRDPKPLLARREVLLLAAVAAAKAVIEAHYAM